MKKLFLFIITMAIVKLSVGQTNTFPASGNVGIGTTTPVSKLSFNNLNDGSDGADGIGWYSGNPLTYGIYRTPGTWVPPAFQQLKLAWDTGIILDPGASYGKSYVDVQGAGLRVSSGNVGIGTISPTTGLQIGNIGSGIAEKQIFIPGVYNFEGMRLGQMGNGNSMIEMINHTSINDSYGIRLKADVDNGGQGFQLQYASSNGSYTSLNYQTGLFMSVNGNIGINTLTPNEKLAVNGKIRAKEIKVEANNWPDYVFEEGYKVGTLEELEHYVKTNKHLPEMPTAAEVAKNGVELGEMNKLLLKKVEELTLHLIEKDKQLQNYDKRLSDLEDERLAIKEFLKLNKIKQ